MEEAMKKIIVITLLAAASFTALRAQDEVLTVDPALPHYLKVSGISGSLSSVGSDSMNNMMTLWAETFRSFYPGVRIQVEGKGSSTAPPALIAGTAQLGPMSRVMRSTEIDQFVDKYGYKPTVLRTSYDALAIYVNKDNPIKSLTLAQVEAIFGKSRKRGHPENITTWGQLGLTGDWAQRPISLYGRNSASGTYGFVKEHVLKNGDYKDTVKEQPGSASVVQGVAEDRFGIGYSGIGYKTSSVRAVPLADSPGSPVYAGTYDEVRGSKYPLSRFLYVYVNKAPGRPLDPIVGEFLALIFSKEGQEVVIKDGYMPLTATQCTEELAKVSRVTSTD
jgi:phosphate transport system substrate-binding protein